MNRTHRSSLRLTIYALAMLWVLGGGLASAARTKPPAQQRKTNTLPPLTLVQGVPLLRLSSPLGFSIELPIGVKSHPCRREQCSFGHWWGQFYLSVTVRRLPKRITLISFIRDTLRLRDESSIASRGVLTGGGFVVVMRAEGRLLRSQVVHVLIPNADGMLRATCSSSPDVLPLLEHVCRSLTSVKPKEPSKTPRR